MQRSYLWWQPNWVVFVYCSMNLTYKTVMRSCYEPGKILSNARWERTSPEGRRRIRKGFPSEARKWREEKETLLYVSRCYSSVVITFSGFPEHCIIFYQVYKTIEWRFAGFYSIKTKAMRGTRVQWTIKVTNNSSAHCDIDFLIIVSCSLVVEHLDYQFLGGVEQNWEKGRTRLQK